MQCLDRQGVARAQNIYSNWYRLPRHTILRILVGAERLSEVIGIHFFHTKKDRLPFFFIRFGEWLFHGLWVAGVAPISPQRKASVLNFFRFSDYDIFQGFLCVRAHL